MYVLKAGSGCISRSKTEKIVYIVFLHLPVDLLGMWQILNKNLW